MPRAGKHCARCGSTHQGRVCRDCYPQWQGSSSPTSTRQSRKLRAIVLEEEPMCVDCGIRPSTELGHIIGAAQGGELTRENSKGQCRQCNLDQMRRDKAAAQNGDDHSENG